MSNIVGKGMRHGYESTMFLQTFLRLNLACISLPVIDLNVCLFCWFLGSLFACLPVFVCFVLSCFILSCFVLSCFVLFCFVLFCLFVCLFYFVLFCFVLFCLFVCLIDCPVAYLLVCLLFAFFVYLFACYLVC